MSYFPPGYTSSEPTCPVCGDTGIDWAPAPDHYTRTDRYQRDFYTCTCGSYFLVDRSEGEVVVLIDALDCPPCPVCHTPYHSRPLPEPHVYRCYHCYHTHTAPEHPHPRYGTFLDSYGSQALIPVQAQAQAQAPFELVAVLLPTPDPTPAEEA